MAHRPAPAVGEEVWDPPEIEVFEYTPFNRRLFYEGDNLLSRVLK